MNREQAIEMISKNVKVNHKMFTDTEWISKHPKSKRHYIDEKGSVFLVTEFWRWRTGAKWDKDWDILKNQNDKSKK